MMSTPLLEVTGLTVRYGPRAALTSVDLCLAEGELVGLIGPNGSGKSTLLRTLAGALRPTTGEVRLLSRELRSFAPGALAQRVAVVPQNPLLPEAVRVRDYVLLGRTPHLRLLASEGPADHTAAQRAMELTECWHLADRPLADLSGGERQRAVVARALAQEPALLLLDEPTTHLDIGHQGALLDALLQLQRESPLTILAVFHDLNLAAQYCPRLVLLVDGQVVADGLPHAVLQPERLAAVYGQHAVVAAHPRNGAPVVLPLRPA